MDIKSGEAPVHCLFSHADLMIPAPDYLLPEREYDVLPGH
jgi:hypothetical protein